MTTTKNKYSVSKAVKTWSNGRTSTWFLSRRDEEQGKNLQLEMDGWKVTAL